MTLIVTLMADPSPSNSSVGRRACIMKPKTLLTPRTSRWPFNGVLMWVFREYERALIVGIEGILRVHVSQIVYTLGPMYLYSAYFKAKVYTIRVHGPLGEY